MTNNPSIKLWIGVKRARPVMSDSMVNVIEAYNVVNPLCKLGARPATYIVIRIIFTQGDID